MPPKHAYGLIGFVALGLGCPPAASSDDGGGTGAVASSSSTAAGSSGASSSGVDPDSTTGEATGDGGSSSASTDASTGGTASAETATFECDPTHVCVAAVPEGWTGPVALRTVEPDAKAECGAEYSALEEGLSLGGLAAPPYDCDCDCEPGTVACGGTVRVRMSGEAVISGQSPCTLIGGQGGPAALFEEDVSAATPTTFDYGAMPYEGWGEHGVTVDEVDVGPTVGACTAVPTVRPTPAAWGERTIACRAEGAFEACGASEVCVPRPLAPFDAPVCIWTEGDTDCPGAFPDKTLRHRDVDDDRGCETCTCGAPNANCEGPQVLVDVESTTGFVSGDTFDAPNAFCELHEAVLFCAPGIDCGVLDSVVEVSLDPGELVFPTPTIPCPPQGGAAIGDAVPAQPVTYCCTEG